MAETRGTVVPQVLSPARAAMRRRIVEAAIGLATEGGYDAVGLRQVAVAAGVSVPTVYQHVSSKDELLVAALMALGERSTERVRSTAPAGDSPAARLGAVFRRILREAGRKPLLYQALYRGYVASAPTGIGSGVGSEVVVGFGPEQAAWIGHTLRAGDLGGHDDAELDSAAAILSCLFLGAMVSVAAGREVAEVTHILEDATYRLLPDASPSIGGTCRGAGET